jgi:hypothetical protein
MFLITDEWAAENLNLVDPDIIDVFSNDVIARKFINGDANEVVNTWSFNEIIPAGSWPWFTDGWWNKWHSDQPRTTIGASGLDAFKDPTPPSVARGL